MNTTLLRKLFVETATQMQSCYTFKQIADKFYEYGIIDEPENPYGKYTGNKRDYVLEKLINAKDITGFLDGLVEEILFDINFGEIGESTTIEFLLKKMGYTELDPSLGGYPGQLVPPDDISSLARKIEPARERIKTENLPEEIVSLVQELSDNLERKNTYSCALLTRKIITVSVFIALDRKKKSNLLKDASGNDFELNKSLQVAQKELSISDHIMSRIRSAKWIGDSANHSYKVKINETDIYTCVTGLRLFLEELF